MAEELAGAVAPASPAIPAPGANPVIAPDAPTGQESATPQGEESVKPTKTYTDEEVRKTVSERLAKERRRLERTLRAELRAENAERQLQELQRPREQPQSQGEPKATDFEQYEDYLLAKAEYRLEQKLAKQREQSAKESDAQSEQRSRAEEAREFHDKVLVKGREKYGAEFDDAITGDVPVTPPMAKALLKLTNGADVAWHLAHNVEDALRIANLSPVEQVWELKDLSAKLASPPKATQTPPPIIPGNGAASAKKDWGDMTTKEHAEAYFAKKQRRR